MMSCRPAWVMETVSTKTVGDGGWGMGDGEEAVQLGHVPFEDFRTDKIMATKCFINDFSYLETHKKIFLASKIEMEQPPHFK